MAEIRSASMPIRAHQARRRADAARAASHDVLICGASFAGLAVARELAGSGADVLVVDRYEIGERQTSACGIPTEWLRATGADGRRAPALRQLVDPHPARHHPLRAPLDLLDLRLPRALRAALARVRRHASRPPRSNGRAAPANGDGAIAVETDRGDGLRAAGRRRARLAPDARHRRRLPAARRAALARPRGPPGGQRRGPRDLDRPPLRARRLRLVASPPRDELRIGVGSFDPRFHVKDTTVLLAEDLGKRADPIPGQLDPPQAAPRRPRAASSSSATRPATACR